jgi:hypothetical protein
MFVFCRGHVRSARVLNAELKSEFDNVPRKPPGTEPRHASRIGLRIILYLKFELNNLQVQPRRNQLRVDHRLVRDRRYLYRVTAADPFRCPPREPRWNAPRMKLGIEVGIELGIEQYLLQNPKNQRRVGRGFGAGQSDQAIAATRIATYPQTAHSCQYPRIPINIGRNMPLPS